CLSVGLTPAFAVNDGINVFANAANTAAAATLAKTITQATTQADFRSASQTQAATHGTVQDHHGRPISNVSISIKGKPEKTATNAKGQFQLNTLTRNDILIFEHLSFESQQLTYNGQPNLTVRLAEKSTEMDEIVVLGYGSQIKESVTGAVSTISADELGKTRASTFTEGMIGKMPGVQISQTTGVP